MKILILGGGRAGLGAAWRLNELGYSDWHLLEALRGRPEVTLSDPSHANGKKHPFPFERWAN